MANPEFAKVLAARFTVVHTPRRPIGKRRFKVLSKILPLMLGLLAAGYLVHARPFRAATLNLSAHSKTNGDTIEVAEELLGSAMETSDFENISRPRLLTSGQPLVLPAPPHHAKGDLANVASALSSRVCGSPANQGYARLVYPLAPSSSCLAQSPTALWHQQVSAAGRQEVLEPHYEQAALYDGLAVAWGHTNKKASVEECAAQCLHFKPGKNIKKACLYWKLASYMGNLQHLKVCR
uniref:Uncharacterized protein n=1 Tax=Dunaliella tertiolecta TaxID=3047 RepID=A0A7S3R9P4_DUNTE